MADATSDDRKSVFGQCFHGCQATLIVGKEKKELSVCKEQLAKASEFFQVMFCKDFEEKTQNQFKITDETPEDMSRFFEILVGLDPRSNKITDDSIELLIRLADKYRCDFLKERLIIYIEENEPTCKSAETMLNWFIWSKKYDMPEKIVKLCLPGMACLPLSILSANKEKIGLELYAKLLEAKVQVNFKAFAFEKKRYQVQERIDKCRVCGMKDRLPYKFYYCTNFPSHNCAYCSNCLQNFNENNRNCDYCRFYYKCFCCENDPSSYEKVEHCFCGRKNYENLLNETA